MGFPQSVQELYWNPLHVRPRTSESNKVWCDTFGLARAPEPPGPFLLLLDGHDKMEPPQTEVVEYPNVESARRSVPHCCEVPAPVLLLCQTLWWFISTSSCVWAAVQTKSTRSSSHSYYVYMSSDGAQKRDSPLWRHRTVRFTFLKVLQVWQTGR